MAYTPVGVHTRVLEALVGRTPQTALQLARLLRVSPMQVRAALYRLSKRHAVRLAGVTPVHRHEGIDAQMPVWEATGAP